MTYSGNRNYGQEATALLATTVVVLLGIGVCTFIVAFLADDPKFPMFVCGGMAVLVILLARILGPKRRTPLRDSHGAIVSTNEEKWEDVDFDRVKPRRKRTVKSFGTNEPPTPQQLRELADGPHNWVPQGAGYKEKPPIRKMTPYKEGTPPKDEPGNKPPKAK
ncbi:MAG: hypothetical protein O2955_06195 [Planctomycetota bacterium]|nr:hypothetical protein [Planctomycetota bacterium]MDA1212085.1 hypothetical protein [Planctomycetota bacterium]